MPIYEYKCQQCGLEIEVRQSVSDDPLTTCEKCHGQLEKQWSLSGFQFKGAGWYVTDYSSKGKSSKSDEKSTKSESTSSTETASKTTSETTSKASTE
ncbi:MAG TPA: zinc ribbon domain-containing protein [Pyrinomonadaceae bacterium]|mgnify:CR=1 FL=1|nr:zinc ribbon domain-containing protein [Pyrinomonadaceae bacterium]